MDSVIKVIKYQPTIIDTKVTTTLYTWIHLTQPVQLYSGCHGADSALHQLVSSL